MRHVMFDYRCQKTALRGQCTVSAGLLVVTGRHIHCGREAKSQPHNLVRTVRWIKSSTRKDMAAGNIEGDFSCNCPRKTAASDVVADSAAALSRLYWER